MLSPEWLTAALGGADERLVEEVTVVEMLETLATKVRLRVRWGRDGRDRPGAICIKGYFTEAGLPWASLGSREARFYAELAGSLPVQVPRSFYAGIDNATQHGVVVMEDVVAAGGRFLTALSPYGADQVAATLEQLAALHARTWDDPHLRAEPWLAASFAGYAGVLSDEDLDALLDGPRSVGVPPEVRGAARLKAALGALSERHTGYPGCLVHADAHAGNLYEAADGTPGLVDWQIYQFAHWSIDVAYHVGAVLEPSEREGNERDLLAYYLDRLRAGGVEAPAPDRAWDEYRASLAYGYFMWAITRRVDPEVISVFNHRLGLAVAQNGSLDLLAV